jgi:hypothetical protein
MNPIESPPGARDTRPPVWPSGSQQAMRRYDGHSHRLAGAAPHIKALPKDSGLYGYSPNPRNYAPTRHRPEGSQSSCAHMRRPAFPATSPSLFWERLCRLRAARLARGGTRASRNPSFPAVASGVGLCSVTAPAWRTLGAPQSSPRSTARQGGAVRAARAANPI